MPRRGGIPWRAASPGELRTACRPKPPASQRRILARRNALKARMLFPGHLESSTRRTVSAIPATNSPARRQRASVQRLEPVPRQDRAASADRCGAPFASVRTVSVGQTRRVLARSTWLRLRRPRPGHPPRGFGSAQRKGCSRRQASARRDGRGSRSSRLVSAARDDRARLSCGVGAGFGRSPLPASSASAHGGGSRGAERGRGLRPSIAGGGHGRTRLRFGGRRCTRVRGLRRDRLRAVPPRGDGAGTIQRHEGNGNRQRSPARREEKGSEGRNPMSATGMKQGRQAHGGSRRREVMQNLRAQAVGRGKPDHEAATGCGKTLKGQKTSWEEPSPRIGPGRVTNGQRPPGARRTLEESASP
jgi:hypothetical protein